MRWKSLLPWLERCNPNLGFGCAQGRGRGERSQPASATLKFSGKARSRIFWNIAASRICFARQDFKRVSSSCRTSARKRSVSHVIPNQAKPGGMPAPVKEAKRCTFQLMENKGLIWATDRAAWRLQKLKQRAARARMFNYRTALWNGGPKLPTKTKFDGVLVDAPCSGTGTWGRNPHARWTTTPQDVQELGEMQKQLLENASAALKPGGKLVYAVCALTSVETLAVIEAFDKQFSQFERLLLSNPLDPASMPSATIWLRPQQFAGNGMFIAARVKK